jgi:hypothetical protein
MFNHTEKRARHTREAGPTRQSHQAAFLNLQSVLGNQAVQRLLPPRVQRFVEVSVSGQTINLAENRQPPLSFVPLNGYWVRFDPSRRTDQAYLQMLAGNYTPHIPPPAHGTVPMIQADIHGTNDSGTRTKGCGAMVAADYLGISVMTLLGRYRDAQHASTQALIRQVFDNPNSTQVLQLYQALGIGVSAEDLDDYTKLFSETGQWDGALGWEGHIIRARGHGHQLELWDPQGGFGEFLLPTNKHFQVYTFH